MSLLDGRFRSAAVVMENTEWEPLLRMERILAKILLLLLPILLTTSPLWAESSNWDSLVFDADCWDEACNSDITISDSVAPTTDLSLPYGDVTVGSTSDEKIIINNDGSIDLVMTSVGSLSAPFSIRSDNCSNKTLPASGSCNIYVRFAPTVTGTYSSSFTIPSNDPDEDSVTASVSGTGVISDVADISVTVSGVNDQNLEVPTNYVSIGGSSDTTLIIANNGSTYLDVGIIGMDDPLADPFSIVNDRCTEKSLDAGESCTIVARFSPTASGTFSDTFEIPSNDPDESTVTVTVNGIGSTDSVANIYVMPTEVSINVDVGSSSSAQSITVANDGTGDLTIGTISLIGADTSQFTIQNDNCSSKTLSSSGECTVEVIFSPTSSGEIRTDLTIPSDDLDSSSTNVYLTGNPSVADNTVESSDATISEYKVMDTVSGSPSSFTPIKAESFAASAVEDGMSITFSFPSLPEEPVIYKMVGDEWQEIYPDNSCSGISNIVLNSSNKILKFYIVDNSECDGDSEIGSVEDPVVLGEEKQSGGGGGGGDFFIAIAAFLLLVGTLYRKYRLGFKEKYLTTACAIGLLIGFLLSTGLAFSEELGIRLTGTIIEKDTAFIEDNTTDKQGIYRSGDSLKEYRITKIIKDRITLTGNDREVILFIEGTDNPSGPHLSGEINQIIPPYQGGTKGGVYELATNRLADMLNNVRSDKDEIRVYQHNESGKKAGFRIHYIKGGNDFKSIGIKNGDIFRKVNDLVINDLSDLRKAVHKFRTENSFKIEIKRESQTIILNYRLDERIHYLVPVVSNLLKIRKATTTY